MTRDEFEDRLTRALGADFCYSYFQRSGFANDTVFPWSLVANDKFKREARDFLRRNSIALGKPSCAHLQR